MKPKQGELSEPDLPVGLSQPALRALTAAGCLRLEQVAALSESEVSRLHGIGPKAIRLLHAALAAKGLSFAGTPPSSHA
jgi:hypothetical protein